MCRVRQFGYQHRRRGVLEAQSHSDDSTSTREHGKASGKRLEEYAEDDDHGAHDDCETSANFLDEPPQEENGKDTTETLRTIEDTKFSAGRMVEVVLPVR